MFAPSLFIAIVTVTADTSWCFAFMLSHDQTHSAIFRAVEIVI
jgi:hypothetical protein